MVNEWLRMVADQHYAYGTHDCCTFALDLLSLIHDVEVPVPDYEDRDGAQRMMRQNPPLRLLSRYFVLHELDPADKMEDGDLLIVPELALDRFFAAVNYRGEYLAVKKNKAGYEAYATFLLYLIAGAQRYRLVPH